MSILKWSQVSALAAVLLFPACSEPELAVPELTPEPGFGFLEGRQVYQPQLLSPDGSSLLLVWREEEEEGSNIYVARSEPGDAFSEPVRVNAALGSVGGIDLDELRPALAAGVGGRFAVAWGARDGHVYVAVIRDAAQTFGEPIRLDQVQERAYRGFPAISFNSKGALHGIWIDAREAPPRAEEPADLYLAVVEGNGVQEINLTAQQEASICGCCRPSLEAFGEELVATFRNTGGGFRDISQILIQPDRSFTQPKDLVAPMWELEGCPVAGPVSPRPEQALWMEASLGHWRLLANEDGLDFEVVLEENDDWTPRRPPRRLSSHGSEVTDLLVPGDPHGRRLTYTDGSWQPTPDRFPAWATDGVLLGKQLLLVGTRSGEFQFAQRQLD